MKVVEVATPIIIPQDRTRSSGVHLSGIIRGIALNMGYLDEKWDKPELGNKLLVAIGLAWEDWATKHLHQEVTYHPPEEEVDGIYLTLDGFTNFDDMEYTKVFTEQVSVPDDFSYLLVNEFKTTHKSSRGLSNPQVGFLHKKWWMWLAQLKGYCYVMETRWAKLHPLFLRGDYSYDSGMMSLPEYRTFAFEFTKWEIEENWRMIVNNKHLARPE
jgi:hypothetical protein